MSRCRACNAPIQWATTTQRRLIPLDPGVVDDGNIELVDGVAVVHAQPILGGGRLSHFVTCPDADQFRRR